MNLLLIACAAATLVCCVIAGVFLTFSDFVMRSLAAAEPAGGIESMQLINRKVYRAIFMKLLLGMCAASGVLGVYALFVQHSLATIWTVAGGVSYLVGVLGVTLRFNVPMNQRLDVMPHASPDTVSYWRIYVPRWSFWNYVRSLAAFQAAIFYLLSCITLARYG